MSINVLLADGLKEIGGKVTKEKIVSALGYTPADKTHVEDTTLHITAEERTAWNNKSDFSGDFKDLENSPIEEDESGELVYADEAGNVIAKIGEGGLSTTNVNAKSMNLNGEDLESRLKSLETSSLPNILDDESGEFALSDEDGNVIMKVDKDGVSTTNVNTKTLKLNGEDLNEKLENLKSSMLPNILDDESGEFALADEDGNVIMKVDANGTETTTLTAKNAIINGVDMVNHLENAPDTLEDESGELVYTDEAGNVIAKVGEAGLETTNVAVDAIVLKDTVNGNTYLIQMQNGKLVSFSIALSIQITSPPAKSVYSEGEEFDPTGMVVSAICEDGSEREITNYTCSMSGNIVTIHYREWRTTHTTTLEITLKSIEEALIDFEYTVGDDGTYSITNWKETLNGESSTEMVIPDNENIIL